MHYPRLLALAAALAALIACAPRADAQVLRPEGPELIGPPPIASELPGPIAAPAAAGATYDPANWSYRLDLWQGLFTPEEAAVLHSSSQLLNFGRAFRHLDDQGPLQRANQEEAGSALASSISASLIYYGGQQDDPFAVPVTFSQPGYSFNRALDRQIVPMASDLAQRGRGCGRWEGLDGASLWIARAVAILPNPHGSTGERTAMASVQIGTVSLLSGNWPDFRSMGPSDYVRFGEVWMQRAANAVLATGLGRLMVPRLSAAAESHRALALRRGALPVTLFASSY